MWTKPDTKVDKNGCMVDNIKYFLNLADKNRAYPGVLVAKIVQQHSCVAVARCRQNRIPKVDKNGCMVDIRHFLNLADKNRAYPGVLVAKIGHTVDPLFAFTSIHVCKKEIIMKM